MRRTPLRLLPSVLLTLAIALGPSAGLRPAPRQLAGRYAGDEPAEKQLAELRPAARGMMQDVERFSVAYWKRVRQEEAFRLDLENAEQSVWLLGPLGVYAIE